MLHSQARWHVERSAVRAVQRLPVSRVVDHELIEWRTALRSTSHDNMGMISPNHSPLPQAACLTTNRPVHAHNAYLKSIERPREPRTRNP